MQFPVRRREQFGLHVALWTLNGLAQSMGWAPCGRSLGHWYSTRERGKVFSFWNLALNVGGGLTGLIAAYSTAWMGWRWAFFVPGILALLCAAYLVLRCGHAADRWVCRPSRNTATIIRLAAARDREEELGTRELLVNCV